MVLSRLRTQASESYEDLRESVRDTTNVVLFGDNYEVNDPSSGGAKVSELDRRKLIVAGGSTVLGWEGLKRVPGAVGAVIEQSPYQITREDQQGSDGSGFDGGDAGNNEDQDEEVDFTERTISEMLELEGKGARESFSDYICEAEPSDLQAYDIRNIDEPGKVEFRYDEKSWMGIQESRPGFSASRRFENYLVENHQNNTLDDQLEEYWEDECR